MVTKDTMVINATKEAAEAIRDVIDAQPGSQTRLTERHNLDGSTATWILVAQLGVQALPSVLALLKEYLPARRVTKLKYGDLEIENPTLDDLHDLRARLEARATQERTSG
jgi:hypothetical protein